MDILNRLKLKLYRKPLWAMAPEFAVIDAIIVEKPDIVETIAPDVLSGLKNNKMGRRDNPTVEQVLRLAIYKEIQGLTYKQLEFHQYDSTLCMEFSGIEKGFSDSALQGYISKIHADKLKLIMVQIVQVACEMGYENLEDIRIDSTPVEADVQRPTNNSLVYDCIKSATLFFEKIKDGYVETFEKIESKRTEAKKINYELNNVKGSKDDKQSAKEAKAEKMKTLFTDYLELFKDIHVEVKKLTENGLDDLKQGEDKKIIELEKNMSVVYNNAYRFQIEGKKVKNEDKIFSIYETHTDIIVKGLRDIIFGHKVNLATGKSNMILFCSIEDGNPSDKLLYKVPILTIKKDFGVGKFLGCATDGGYASLENREFAKKHFTNIVFTKVVGSLQNICETKEVGDGLKKWRAGIEGCISNLKRKYNLNRVTWKGRAMFDAKVLWSVIAYNIRVLTGHILEDLKTT